MLWRTLSSRTCAAPSVGSFRFRTEVHGLFTDLLPPPLPRTAAEADSERRAREGMVPDAAGPMAGNDGHGGHGDGVDGPERLFDLKTLHWGVSTYPRARVLADGVASCVDRRAQDVDRDYQAHARKLDAEP